MAFVARALVTGLTLGLGLSLLACGCVDVAGGPPGLRELQVTATAYNSLVGQTNEEPTITAWGHELEPGMKSIAVSRDLIDLGLTNGVVVEIVGLKGRYVVRDKMAKRWRRKIDIYMGEDVKAARRWGKQRVTIRWTPQDS